MRVTNHNATIIDHILANSFDSKIDTGIFKVDISDHFPIFFTSKSVNIKTSQDLVVVTKRHLLHFPSSKRNYSKLTGDYSILLKIRIKLIKHFQMYLITFMKSPSQK